MSLQILLEQRSHPARRSSALRRHPIRVQSQRIRPPETAIEQAGQPHFLAQAELADYGPPARRDQAGKSGSRAVSSTGHQPRTSILRGVLEREQSSGVFDVIQLLLLRWHKNVLDRPF